jgi:hypothetical protein
VSAKAGPKTGATETVFDEVMAGHKESAKPMSLPEGMNPDNDEEGEEDNPEPPGMGLREEDHDLVGEAPEDHRQEG